MKNQTEAKSARMLAIYSRLVNGEVLKKTDLAQYYHVTERSIQRDMESLRCFFSNQMLMQDIVYDFQAKGYRLTDSRPKGFTNSEILSVCKILLESRSMKKEEMFPIIDKLVECCVPTGNRKVVHELVANEKFHYIEPHHQKHILSGLWEIGLAIQHQSVMEIDYEKMGRTEIVHRTIEPVGLLFSEYYFYLAAFIRNIDKEASFQNPRDQFPTIYRIDRIQAFLVTDEHFKVPYSNRFEAGEFRKRIQFMYGGALQQITFKYNGPSIEAVLDRLPTAKIIQQDETGWIVTAEVFGKGIEMWLRSQGEYVRRIE